MCYHRQQRETIQDVADYYSASYEKVMAEIYAEPRIYENGFDYRPGIVVTTEKPKELQLYKWGLIPHFAKTKDYPKIANTLNCVSENAYATDSYRDSMNAGKRCLLPATGFFEWRHLGKVKYPYFIFLKNQKLFSIGGIYSQWVDRTSGEEISSYSVLTTKANSLMEKIHNSKKRMPVIIPREYEKDWLDPNLTKDQVMALCQPIDAALMDAYTISKMITNRSVEDKNVPAISERFEYPELALIDS